MASGIKLSDDALEKYNQLQLPKGDDVRYRYLIFHIQGGKEIVVEDKKEFRLQDNSDPFKDFTEFRKKMSEKSSRYAVFDYGSKPVLIMWNPGSASVREKMVYASSFDAIKRKFTGVGTIIQADDINELDLEEIRSKDKSQASCKK